MNRLYFIKDIKKNNKPCLRFDGDKSYIATADIQGSQIINSTIIEFENKPSRANIIASNGAVLFAKMKGTIKVFLVDEVTEQFVYSTGFYCFNDSRLYSPYLKYFLLSKNFNEMKDKLSTGATMEAINDSSLEKISVPLYDLNEQKKIALKFDLLHDRVGLLEQEIKLLDELVEAKFDEMFGVGKIKYTEARNIIIDRYRGNGIKKDQITRVGQSCVRYAEIFTTYKETFTECVSHIDADLISSKKYFSYGDLLFAITSENIDDILMNIVYLGTETCIAGGDMIVVKHDQNPIFLNYAFLTKNAIDQKKDGKNKQKVVHAKYDDIEKIMIPIPSIELQEVFAEFYITSNSNKDFIAKQIALTKELINKKMDEYFGG